MLRPLRNIRYTQRQHCLYQTWSEEVTMMIPCPLAEGIFMGCGTWKTILECHSDYLFRYFGITHNAIYREQIALGLFLSFLLWRFFFPQRGTGWTHNFVWGGSLFLHSDWTRIPCDGTRCDFRHAPTSAASRCSLSGGVENMDLAINRNAFLCFSPPPLFLFLSFSTTYYTRRHR